MTFCRLSHQYFPSWRPFPLLLFHSLSQWLLTNLTPMLFSPNVTSFSYFPRLFPPTVLAQTHRPCRLPDDPFLIPPPVSLSPSPSTAIYSPSPACSQPGALPLPGTCYGNGLDVAGSCTCQVRLTGAAVYSRTAWELHRREKDMWKVKLSEHFFTVLMQIKR